MKKIIIVGSGVAGATIAKELAQKDVSIKIVEKGSFHDQLGIMKIAGVYSELSKKPQEDNVLIHTAIMGGGSGVVACANGVRTLQKELAVLGVDLEEEFEETEKELKIGPVPQKNLGSRALKFMAASKELGYQMDPMPKFVNYDNCVGCGMCILGCAFDAKWSPLDYLKDLEDKGIEIISNITVTEVVQKDGKVQGIKGVGPEEEVFFEADLVILAAGGIGTPVILQNSGIDNAGGNFFVDMYINTFGTLEEENMKPELPMATLISEFHEEKGFILSPYLPPLPTIAFMPPISKEWKKLERAQTIGIMTKISDECGGRVNADGSVEKKVTDQDRAKLLAGEEIAKKLLVQVGCKEESVFSTNVESAHPGGTAAIGKVVDNYLETQIKGLYVGDASVLPVAAGAPPIITIIALAKRLSKYIKQQL